MNIQNLTFAQTHTFSKLIIDYVNHAKKIERFAAYNHSIEAVEKIIEDKSKEKIDRKLLTETIVNQYKNITSSSPEGLVWQNIRLFEQENTFCVVTAHQLNIFGGTLYYIYKIAQTISTCKLLKTKYPDYNFVPVYWMGSEDHDFEEINHINIYHKKLEWTDRQGGATGNYTTNTLDTLLDELNELIHNQPFGSALMQLFRQAYRQANLADATRFWLHHVFGEYGLVVVDGNDSTFKQQFSAIMEDDLLHHHALDLVTQTVEQLEADGYKMQAMPRAVNLFYIDKNIRERIEYDATTQQYRVLHTEKSFTKNELQEELKQHPEKFSPNVILRPLFQQKVLPGIAYIGGAGEISYWLQLKTTFEHYQVNFPQLIVRNSALLLNKHAKERMQKLNLQTEDLFDSVEDLKKNYINCRKNIFIDDEIKAIEMQFKSIQEKVQEIDAGLVAFVGAEAHKTLKSIENIEAKINKSLKQKNETALNQLEKLKAQLFPNNSLQERIENFSGYYADSGQAFIEQLIAVFNVYEKQFLVIEN
jgi:bacillithiol biosynthesis cysteine-adding enzyme BshC